MSEPTFPDRYVFAGVAMAAASGAGWIAAETLHGIRPTWEYGGAAVLLVIGMVIGWFALRFAEEVDADA